MKIDTLVFSGGSTKMPAFIGAMRALKEKYILDDKLTGIHHIIVCSVGMFYGLLLLLGINDRVIEQTVKLFNFSDLLDMDNININSLLFDLGLFDNHKVARVFETILREKYSKETMTMKELYELTNIKLTAKVCNHTRSCIEYISYENHPEATITQVLLMTTAIPLFFKPIKFKGCLYIDGGAAGGFATEIAGENYIGLQLKGPNKTDKKETLMDEIPLINYFIQGLSIACEDYTKPDNKKIIIPSDIHFTNFNLTLEDKQKLIEDGYNYTKEHIEAYEITNDLLKIPPVEDTDPSEEVHNQE